MAIDWIKMRTDVYRDPKVILMADILMAQDSELMRHVYAVTSRDCHVTRNVMRHVTVGALVSVWGVMRHQGARNDDDLFMRNVTLQVLDDVADLPGIGHAMESVGWAVETDDGVLFPRFFTENNADPATQEREKARERQRRYRDKKRDVTSRVTGDVTKRNKVTPREEKNREEKRRGGGEEPPPKNGSFSQIEIPKNLKPVSSTIQRWAEHSFLAGQNQPTTFIAQLQEFSRRGPEASAEIIERSIRDGAGKKPYWDDFASGGKKYAEHSEDAPGVKCDAYGRPLDGSVLR